MVTGDNLQTAMAIAKECGILRREFQPDQSSVVMEGKAFRELVGGLKIEKDDEGKEIKKVANLDSFERVVTNMRVLARATPEDKVYFR